MDLILDKIYKKMFGIENIESIVENINTSDVETTNVSIVFNNVSVNSNLVISGNSYLYSDLIFNNDIDIVNNIINTNNLYTSSLSINNCNVSNTLSCMSTIICNNMNVNTNMYISTSSYINNNLTIMSDLNIGESCIVKNMYTRNISSNSTLNIISDIINIGDANTIISFNGSKLNLLNTELEVSNKIISLNFNSDLSKIDSSKSCGFEIYTNNNNNGYIKTNIDNSCFDIKLPNDNNIKRIVVLDINNNIYISGYSIFNNNVTVCNSLYVSQNLIANNTSVDNNLYISGTATINNIYISNISVINDSIINNNLCITNLNILNNCNLNILEDCNLNNNVTCKSKFNCTDIVCNNINISNNITLFNLSNLLINNNLTVKSNLSTNNLNIQGNINISNCNILNTALFTNNVSTSTLYINKDCIINDITILSKLIVKKNMTVLKNITITSNLYSNCNLVIPLKHFSDSRTAALGGIPLGGLFRTGNIVRIRINIIPPTILLIGASVLTVNKNTIYNEPGIYISDNIDNLIPYIISIKSNNVELLTSAIPVSNSLNIPQINTSTEGNYIFTYMVIDKFNNISTIIRTINIIWILANLVQFNDTSIARTFMYNGKDFGNVAVEPSVTITNNTIVQVGGSSMWGFKGSSMPQVDFSYNGKWSVMIKFKLTLFKGGTGTVAEVQFDNKLDGWGLPGRCSYIADAPGVDSTFIPIRPDLISGNGTNIMFPTFFSPLINAEFLTGVYFVISRLGNYMQFKAYNLQGVLRWSMRSYNAFTYTYNQTLFTMYLYPPYCNYTFYNGVLTSTIVELTPAHWNTYVI